MNKTPATGTLYKDFQKRFKLFVRKRPDLVENTLSNIFTMRLIGNKTHGDLAEIGIAEFIHQFMYDFDSRHVGKDLFRLALNSTENGHKSANVILQTDIDNMKHKTI